MVARQDQHPGRKEAKLVELKVPGRKEVVAEEAESNLSQNIGFYLNKI